MRFCERSTLSALNMFDDYEPMPRKFDRAHAGLCHRGCAANAMISCRKLSDGTQDRRVHDFSGKQFRMLLQL